MKTIDREVYFVHRSRRSFSFCPARSAFRSAMKPLSSFISICKVSIVVKRLNGAFLHQFETFGKRGWKLFNLAPTPRRSGQMKISRHRFRTWTAVFVLLSLGSMGFGGTNQPVLNFGLDGQRFALLSWQLQSNCLYHLEARADLFTGQWMTVAVSNLQLTLTGSTTTAKLAPVDAQQFYRLGALPINRFGAHASAGNRPDIPTYLNDLGASWARVNANLDGKDPPFASF